VDGGDVRRLTWVAPHAAFKSWFYTTKPGGLGMGLSIIRSIIDRHGGRIWARSNAAYGSTFHFTLPAIP